MKKEEGILMESFKDVLNKLDCGLLLDSALIY